MAQENISYKFLWFIAAAGLFPKLDKKIKLPFQNKLKFTRVIGAVIFFALNINSLFSNAYHVLEIAEIKLKLKNNTSRLTGHQGLDMSATWIALFTFLCLVMLLIISFSNCRNIANVLNTFRKVNTILKLNRKRFYVKYLIIHIVMTFSNIVLAANVFATYDSTTSLINQFSFINVTIFEVTIFVICDEMKYTYRAINEEILEKLTKNHLPYNANSTPIRIHNKIHISILKNINDEIEQSERIAQLRYAHSLLSDAQQQFNNHIGPYVTCDIAGLFSQGLACFLHIITYSFISSSLKTICLFTLTLECYYKLLMYSYKCDGVSYEANRTAEITTRIVSRVMNEASIKELQMFSSQVRACKIRFTACRLFTIDLKFVFSIMGATVSYIFIMTQLK